MDEGPAIEKDVPCEDQPPISQVIHAGNSALSPGNRNPWTVSVDSPSSFTLTVSGERVLRARDPFAREAHIAAGGFLELASCAASTMDLATETLLFPDGWYSPRETTGLPLARVVLETGRGILPDSLSAAIPYRPAPGGVYPPGPIGEEVLEHLSEACSETRCPLVLTTRKGYISDIAGVLERAAVVACRDPALRTELTAFFARNIEKGGYRGLRGLFQDLSYRVMRLSSGPDAAFATRYPAMVRSEALSAAAFAWIAAPDTRPDQVRVGRAFARVALAARIEGLPLHPMTLPLSDSPAMEPLRDEIRSCLGIPDAQRAHILFRLGGAAGHRGTAGRHRKAIVPPRSVPRADGEQAVE